MCRVGRGTCAAVTVLAITIPLVCLSYLAFGDNSLPQPPETLILASVLFRHGDRTPTDMYPTDPYLDPSFWPEGKGALTTVGKQEAYTLGLLLRQRYSRFLPELYSPDDVYIVSSDHDRCLMSAELCLAGLYPPKASQLWKEDLLWQPVPVHTVPRSLDQLIVVAKPCPRYEKELSRVRNSTVSTEEEQKLFEYLSQQTGKSITDILGAELLFNTLEIEEKRGLKLPPWTVSVYPEPLRSIAARSLALFTETELLKRLKGGPFVKEVQSHMADKALRVLRPDRKLFLYSGHDLTLVSVLRTLGAPGLLKPDPAAALFIELHRALDGSQHFIEILYLNNTSSNNLERIHLPGCTHPCSLSTFIKSTSSVVPNDWNLECNQ